MKTRLRRALAMIALIAFVVTMLPISAFAEARTSFIRSRIDSRPVQPDSGIEIVPHKTENPKRSAIWDGSIAAGFAGGSGTEDDPYLISNGSELAYLAQQVNSGNRYENVHFKLTNDIYLNDTTDWELWGTTGSSSAGKADTCDGSAIEPTEQNKGDKVDVPIAIPVRPAPKTELESDTLSDALNAAGQSNTFVSTGSYPWLVDSTTYDGRTAAKSGNHNVSSSTSSFSTTVTLSVGDIISFEYCVSSESNYDEFEFSVNDSVVLTESGVVSWNSYSYQATTDGEYTFLWSYTKDSNANGNSDACWVDNVYIGAPIAVTGIDVLEQLDIPVNGTGTVTYSVLPENAYNKNVSFESADAGIAAVNANGVVTGVSAGETTITVTTEDGGFTGACTINVYNQAVTGVTIEPSEAELTVGSSTKLTATVLPENATNKNVIYSVDDESILSVDQDGNVTGLSLGTATVTVTTEDGGFTASAEINMIPVQVTGVGLSPEAASVGLGHTIQLTASIKPSNAANKNLSWSVSDETIISVDDRGIVTGLSLGTATATVTTEDGGFTASAEITVCYAPSNTWTAIGTESNCFYGCFDGNGYAVRGIYINTQESFQGLFGFGKCSVIANLGVAESYIYGNKYVGGVVGESAMGGSVTNCYNAGSVTGNEYVGGVVGWKYGAVTDCYNAGSVTGNEYVGGVIGFNGYSNSIVTDCYNTGKVNGNRSVGGVVGDNYGTVINCYNTGNVTGNKDVGGVIGDNGGTVTDCYNTNIIAGNKCVGGVVGYGWRDDSTVADCYNTGSVTGEEYVGGVVGHNLGTITDCYNMGSVTGDEEVGGVVGYNDSFVDEGTVTNCYNTGSITGSNYVGGVAGDNLGTVTDCYNMSSVTGDESVGGVVGYIGYNDGGTVTNCYYYVDCCASSNSYGTALTSEQMLRAESFEGFDFETVWTMDGNPGYPYPKLINNFQAASPTTDDVVFSIENITAAPGTDVSVAFTVEGEYEAHALTAFVRYDTNMLSVVGNGIAQGNIWQNMIAGGGTIVADAVTRPGQVPFMAIMPTNPFSGSGTIFTMNFHVNESVELGTVIPLELEIREFYYMPVQQTDPTLIPFTSDNGSITAQVYHSVTFVDYDGTVLSAQSVAHGSAAIEPTAPEREGYAFIGWDKDFSNVTEDMTVTAQYSANSYSITYTINGEEYAVRNYEYGAAVSAPEYTVPEGHTFSGWDIPETMPAQNLVLDAALTVNSYTITYTINGEEYTAQTYEFGAEVSAPEYTVPEGHTFSGWDIPETMPAENLVLDAALTVNEYTVTYNINGEIYAIQVYAYGEEVFAPAYDVPDHFTFSGWDTPATMPAENIVLDATLVEDGKYTVSFMVDGETYFTFTGYEGDVITVPEDPEKLGYTFDAWDGMPEDGVLPAANITVTAVWIVNTYTITYTVNGEEYSVRTYEYGAAIITPAYDVPEGYTFSGWDVPETMPAEDLVVDATCTINVYEVTLIDGLNGDPIAVLYVAHGQDAVLPDAPEHAGYIFDRWDGDPTNVTEDRTITACYWMIGDVNHDGEITTYDALLIMRYALGVETDGNELIMDFNGDGCVDSLDALLVLRRSIV